MKNLISLLLTLAIAIILVQSCRLPKCRNGKDGPIADIDSTLLVYFGKYRPNNWWVYENTLKNKRDSVFINKVGFGDGGMAVDPYADACQYERHISGTLSFTYLGTVYDKDPSSFDMFKNSLSIEHTGVFIHTDSSKLFNSYGSASFIDSFRLPSGEFFSKVLKLTNTNFGGNQAVFIAPNIGIIRFDNRTDTFFLTRFKIN